MTAEIELARRLEQSISLASAPMPSGTESVARGPFRAFFFSHTANPQLNYAMPIAAAEPGVLAAAIDDLRAVFRARDRRLRFEFVEELWPGLASALQRAGLQLQAREPLMACPKGEFIAAAAPTVSVRALSVDDRDADIAAFVTIRDEQPIDGSRPASPRSIAAVRERLRAGSELCAIASVDDRAAGIGRCLLQPDGLGEVTSIVTLPDFRRRGVAAAVVSFLVRGLIASGRSIAWLNAANEQAVSVYARLGFRSVGTLLNYEDASAGS